MSGLGAPGGGSPEAAGTRARTPRELARHASLRASAIAASIAALAFGLPALWGNHPFGFDLSRIDLGIVCALKERLASGEGFWVSPLLGNGDPLLSKPETQLFYLPRLVGLLLPVDASISFYVAFHLSLAAAFATWLARTFGQRPITAACSGLAFAFSGTVLDLISHSHYLAAAAWLPLAWAAARRGLASRPRPWHLLACGGALACLLLAGEPQAFCIASALIALEALRRWVRSRQRLDAKALRFLFIPPAALAIGLAQWTAIFAELPLGDRAGALPRGEALMWAFTPPLWIATVVPGLLTQRVWPLANIWHVWHGSLSEHYPWNPQPYWGALLLAAIPCGLALKRARSATAVFATALLFSLGSQTPVLPLLMKLVPPLALFRYPAKYLVVAGLAGTMVAGLGLQQIARGRRRRRFVAVGGLFCLGLLGAVAWVWLSRARLDLLPTALDPTEWRPDFPRLSAALLGLLAQGLAPLAIAVAVALGPPRWRQFLPVLIVCDLALAAPSALFFSDGLAGGPSPVRDAAPSAGLEGMILCVDPTLEHKLLWLSSDRLEWDQTLFQRTHLLPEMQACDGITSALPYSSQTASLNVSLQQAVMAGSIRAARALGCTQLLAAQPPRDDPEARVLRLPVRIPGHPEVEAHGAFVNLFEVKDPVPEFFVSAQPVLASSEKDALRRIRSALTTDALLAIVDDPLGRLAPGKSLGPAQPTGAPRGRWITRQHVEVAPAGTGGAVVGVRTSFHVGWSARQAGAPVPVVRVGGNQLGAWVEDLSAGPVEFTYRSPNFALGLLASVLGLCGLGALGLWQRRDSRRTALR